MASISTRVGMALDEYLEQSNSQPFEIINGERRMIVPNVALHTEVIRALFLALYLHVTARLLGEVYSEATFILTDAYDTNWVTGSRIPDVMFYAGNRMAEYKAAAPHWRERPFAIVPDFVAEVVSPNDKVVELDDKIDAYLRDGVRLVWVVYPYVHRPKVMVYTPDAEHPARFAGDVVVDAGDVIPDFKIALPKLFE